MERSHPSSIASRKTGFGRVDVSLAAMKEKRSYRNRCNSSMKPSSKESLDYGSATHMIPELYRSATTGDIDAFKGAAEDTERSPFDQVSPRGNTVLHLAASLGHDQLVKLILHRFPDLVERTNYKGDLALHVAACGGHLPTINSLVHAPQRLAGSTSGNPKAGEAEVNNVLEKKNKEGNTALHVALENHHQEVAEFLVKADPTVSYCQNREEKSPLCMAAEAGYLELIKLMLKKPNEKSKCKSVGGDNPNETLKGKSTEDTVDENENEDSTMSHDRNEESVLHAAIRGRNTGVIDAIWSTGSNDLIHTIDREGRTPLSFAAYIGHLDGVLNLLKKSKDGAYLRDKNGIFPIHMASSEGHIKIVQAFLEHCPDSRELLNKEGQNILHVAAKFGKAKMVSYMLKTRELEMLINERDNGGNTPLHLATVYWHPKVVSILTWDKRVSLELMNKKGLTSMDVAEGKMGQLGHIPFRERLTLIALKSANTPRSQSLSTERDYWKPAYSRRNSLLDHNQYKERVNTLLLVSTLVATVTFAAGFTMPGGHNSSGRDEGMATLVTKRAFHAFLICNTVAMYSSITVAVALIWAQLGDLNLILTAFNWALPLLGVALTMMSLAFMAGVYLVVSNHNWLANVVLIMGSIFLVILLAIFVPLYFPIYSNHCIARYILYYYFCLMILATRSDTDRTKE